MTESLTAELSRKLSHITNATRPIATRVPLYPLASALLDYRSFCDSR